MELRHTQNVFYEVDAKQGVLAATARELPESAAIGE
jgi:hypothetical protein